jgi:putative MATE family efflux protein
MREEAKKHRLGLVEAPIAQALKRLTAPMIIGMAMLFSFNLVDTLFISFLGTEQLTAISFTFPVTFLIMSLAIGLGIGTSAVVAKYMGRADFVRAKEACTVTNYLAIVCGALTVAVCLAFLDPIFRSIGASEQVLVLIRRYMLIWLPGSILLVAIMNSNSILRACGDTRTPSILMAVSGFINAVMDPLLIFGIGPFPTLGIAGAALASLISWMTVFIYLLYILLIRLELIARIAPSRAVLIASSREMLKIGLPAAGANMMTPLAAGIMTAIAAGFGEAAVAAFGVGSRIEPLAMLLILAMSSSLPPLISQNFGARRLDRVAEAYRLATRFIILWQLGIYLVLGLFAGLIARLFSDDPAVIPTIRTFLWILPLGYGLQGIIILTNSSLNALHRPLEALWLSMARFFVFYVPLAWLGSRWFGLPGFFGGALAGIVVMALISLRTFRRALALEMQRMEKAEAA